MENAKKTFSKNLRALIKARGYKSIELFAHENGLDKSWVYRLARGEREPLLTGLIKLARSLGVTLDDLYPMRGKRH